MLLKSGIFESKWELLYLLTFHILQRLPAPSSKAAIDEFWQGFLLDHISY